MTTIDTPGSGPDARRQPSRPEGELRELASREGAELMDAAARGASLDGPEQDALLAYFLGDAPAPNAQSRATYEVDLGDGRTWRCVCHAIEWGEWQDAQTRAFKAESGITDLYVQASWVVARSLEAPKLGPMLQRIRDADAEGAPQDAAALLRRAFSKQAGSLIYLQRKILELSRLDEASAGGVKEVEAGKTSS